ncbi:MAG: LLM class F420-dependent oxidoreductase [Candidatus Tectomicrobia bacterium]
MATKRWALSVPLDGLTLAEHVEIAQAAERLGYTDAWSLEVDGVDCFTPLAVIGQTTQMRLGTAIANAFTRGPATLAMCAAGIAEVAPGRFCLGIGAGSRPTVETWNGTTFRRPASRVREMVQVLRQALAGERVTFQGDTLTVEGFRLSRPPSAPIPIHVAALRPGMLRVAGEVGDGAIINWLSVEDVPGSVHVVREAARQAGRDAEGIEISARLMVSIDPLTPEADTFVRRYIAAYMNVPVYRAFQQWLGRREAFEPMWHAWDHGDRRGAVAAIPEQTINELVVRGSRPDIRAHVQRFLDAGVDTVFLHLLSCETDPVRRHQGLMAAIQDLAPLNRM